MSNTITEPDIQQRLWMLYVLVVVAWLYIIGLSPVLMADHKAFLVGLNVVDGLIAAAVAWRAWRTNRVGLMGDIACLVGVVMISSFLLISGIDGAIYSATAAPVYFYLITSRARATVWAANLMVVYLTAYILVSTGHIALPYSVTNLGLFIASYVVSCVAVYAYASQKDRMEEALAQSVASLAREKASVELQVRERTRQLFEEHAKLAYSIESLSQGLIVVDGHDHIIVRNTSAAKVLGYGKRQWSLDNLAHDAGPDVELYEVLKRVREKGRALTLTGVKLGSRILQLSLAPVLVAKHVISVVMLIEDTTEAKLQERSRDEFFSIASHELRTPLTAIRGNAAMIKQYYGKVLGKDGDLSGMITDIHESSVRLIEIVNDFLDASRLEQGRMQFIPTEFDIAEVIEKVTYELGAYSREKKIYLRLDHDIKSRSLPHVYADIDRVKQVLYNVIGNAMKFVDHGGVAIAAYEVHGRLKISIADTGPGISEDGQRLLFRKFQQASNSIMTRDSTRGTGLGLYISKLLLEQMHGTIDLEHTEVGHGSTFSFTLPLAKPLGHKNIQYKGVAR
jgi:signal transduction histidine kinase